MQLLLNLFFFLFLVVSVSSKAQYLRPDSRSLWHETDTAKSKEPFSFHLSLGTEVVFSKYNSYSLFWVAPEFSYLLSPKVRLNTGFFLGTDLLNASKNLDLSPRKNPKPITNTYVQIVYQPNERLWFAASIFYDNSPLFSPFSTPYSGANAETIGIAADLSYKISESSFIDFHISFSQTSIEGGYNNLNLNSSLDNSFTRTERLIKNTFTSPFRLLDSP